MTDLLLAMVGSRFLTPDTVMHPEFQKWGSVGPWFSKNGAHVTNCGFDDFHQLLLQSIQD